MKLLIVTQAVDLDDPVLAFFHTWIEMFAPRFERIEVVCLKEGRHALPANVRVHSLGKERGPRTRAAYACSFLSFAWRLRRDYDAVFVHMNPEYVALAGPLWRLLGKRIVLWYTHRQVNLKLRIGVLFANVVATVASESMRLATPKKRIVGHGIDTTFFSVAEPRDLHTPLALVSVGRIAPIKRLEVLIDALGFIRERGVEAELTLVGQAIQPGDRAYEERLRRRVAERRLEQWVHFAGATAYRQMPEVYRRADVSINLAPTGGLDKAVLESMACGLPTLMSNQGFAELVGAYRDRLLFRQDDARDLADKLTALYHAEDRATLGAYLRQQVAAHASLDRLIDSLLEMLWPRR